MVLSDGFEKLKTLEISRKPPVSHLVASCALKTRDQVLVETVSATSLSSIVDGFASLTITMRINRPQKPTIAMKASICLITKKLSDLHTGLLRSSGHCLLTVLPRVWI